MTAPGRPARRLGYSWENRLVRRLRDSGINVRRLGTPVKNSPDVVAWTDNVAVAIECKATGGRRPIGVGGEQCRGAYEWATTLMGDRARAYGVLAATWVTQGKRGIEHFWVIGPDVRSGDSVRISASGTVTIESDRFLAPDANPPWTWDELLADLEGKA